MSHDLPSSTELAEVSPFVDQWRPITSSFALVKAPLEYTVETFLRWMKGPANIPGTLGLECIEIDRPFPEAFRALEPFSPGAWRHLFIPTTSEWTVVSDSNLPTPDLNSLAVTFAKRYGLMTIEVLNQPHTLNLKTNKGRYGAYEFALRTPDGYERIVRLLRGSSWQFLAIGDPLPFEHIERYEARHKTDRLDQSLLIEYLGHLNAWPFNEAFYNTPQKSVLVTRFHENNNTPPLYTLEDLRAQAEDA